MLGWSGLISIKQHGYRSKGIFCGIFEMIVFSCFCKWSTRDTCTAFPELISIPWIRLWMHPSGSWGAHYRLQKQDKSVVLAKTVQDHYAALVTFQQFRYTCDVLKFGSSTNQDIVKLQRRHVLCNASVLLGFSTCLLVEIGNGRDQQYSIRTCTSYSCFQTSVGNCRLRGLFVCWMWFFLFVSFVYLFVLFFVCGVFWFVVVVVVVFSIFMLVS